MKTRYFILTVVLFGIELILLQMNGFVRNVLGDFFAVIFLYCLFKSFTTIKSSIVAVGTLILAFGLEFLQLSSLSETSFFQKYEILILLLGTSFSIGDLLAYAIGIGIVYFLDCYYSFPSTKS